MILISHRGNIAGKNPLQENKPEYIDAALLKGYDVEIDLRVVENVLFLGHDEPQYQIEERWIEKRIKNLWIHCKNLEAIEWFNFSNDFNYFWHENDTLTLTSKRYIWAYPGKQPIVNSIAVMPEIYTDNLDFCLGICSDYISNYDSK